MCRESNKCKKKKKMLLIEPSVELQDNQNQTKIELKSSNNKPMHLLNQSADMDHPKKRQNVITENARKGRTKHRGGLSPLLMILFGLMLLLKACSLSQQTNHGMSSLFNSTVLPSFNLTSSSRRTSMDTFTTEILPAEVEGSDIGEEEEEDTVNESIANTDNRIENRNSIGSLLTSAAEEASDKFVANMRPEGEDINEDISEGSKEDANDKMIDKSELEVRHLRDIERRHSSHNSTKDQLDQRQQELKLAMEAYSKWTSTGNDVIELFSRKFLPVIVEHGYEIDPVTVTGLLQLFNGIRGLKPWALKLLDSSTKLGPGILVGTQSDFGDFDECLNVRVDDPSGLDLNGAEIDESTGLKASSVVGRYCLADVEFPKPPRVRLNEKDELGREFAPIELRRPLLDFNETSQFKNTIFVETANFFHMLYVDPIRVGICLTNKIDPDSTAKLMNKIFEDFRVTVNFRGRCLTKYDRPVWTVYQKVSAYILSLMCFIVVLSTFFDIIHIKMNKIPLPFALSVSKLSWQKSLLGYRPFFTSFSIIRNTKRLFKPQANRLSIEHVRLQRSSQFKLNVTQEGCLKTGSKSAASTSGSSLESSPSIERRSSSIASSARNLISDQSMSLKSRKCPSRLLAHFSAESDALTSPINLGCLHGIRVITMTWMVVNHTYLFGGFFVLWAHRRLIDIAEWPKSLSFQLVLNGWLTVETYFFLSAAIIVLNVMPLMETKRFAYFSYIIHRLVRLLPAYIGIVCLNFLSPLVSTGPVWLVKGKSFIQNPCENYLWTNFLFINNWIWPEKQCMVHTWFLSADFQLYLVAPVIVYLLYRRPVFGHSLNIIVAIIASIFSGFVIYANKLLPTTLINKLEFDSIKQQLSYSYFATYQHMGPYCLGIFVGYLLHKRPQARLPKHLTWLLWLVLPPLSFTTLLLTYLWNGAYDEPAMINPPPLVSAFYVAMHRTIWTSLLAWIVFACVTGRAKMMNNFLSHSMFIPLSRLSFSIYLVHLPIIMFRALNLRHTIEWSDSNILWEACGNFIASLMAGYFVNVVFESPIINLEHAIFRKTKNDLKELEPDASKELPRERNLLQPQSTVSITTSESDSDDNKSAESSERASSSLERDRKSIVSDLAELDPKAELKPIQWTNVESKLPKEAELHPREKQVEPSNQEYLDKLFPLTKLRAQQMALANANRYHDYAQDRHQPQAIYERSSHYATLARTSCLNHDSSKQLERSNQFRSPVNAGYQPAKQLRDSQISGQSHELNGDSQLQPFLPHQQRPNRYNTLTTTGTREWRQQYAQAKDDNWRTLSQPQRHLRVPPFDWLQPGTMIPRIDSSTLRRQQTKGPQVSNSIVEEREDSVL